MTWHATVLTLFPGMFPGPLGQSLAGRALAAGLWRLDVRDIRDAATDRHRTVDDTPFGGGAGMVMRPDVLDAALGAGDGRPLLYMTPRGRRLSQARVRALAAGPGATLICGRYEGVDQRVLTAAGVSVGLVGHTALATLGLGAILRTSEWLFIALKLVGAAYLVWLGIGLLRTKTAALVVPDARRRALSRLFVDGALSNLANPKIAVFYFAFLPQFVLPGASHPARAVFALGLLFAALTFLVKGPVGLSAGLLSGWLRSRPAVLAWIHRSSGAVLVALGVKLAFERRP